MLANAAAAPIWAKSSDIWGRKPILLTSSAAFFCSSIVCAKAQTMKMLIIGRSLQGTASGGLVQLVYIVISDIFSMRWVRITSIQIFIHGRTNEYRERSLIMGLTAVMWALAGAVGPVLGGAFAQTIGWRWYSPIILNILANAYAKGGAFGWICRYQDRHSCFSWDFLMSITQRRD